MNSQDLLDPLDQALTNVIQNLIGINEPSTTSSTPSSPSAEAHIAKNATKGDSAMNSFLEDSPAKDSSLESQTEKRDLGSLDTNEDSSEVPFVLVSDSAPCVTEDDPKTADTDGEKAKNEEPPLSPVSHAPSVTVITSTQPVFSIGPFPPSVTSLSVKNVQFTEPPVVIPSNRTFTPVFGAPLSDTDDHCDSVSFSSSFDSTSSISTVIQEAASKSPEKHEVRSVENVTDSDNVSVDLPSGLDVVKENANVDPAPSGSVPETASKEASSEASASKQEENKVATRKTRTPEEALAAREDRLRRLEEQAKWLMNKMNATSRRGSELSTRLEELHEVYGEPPAPPPMPDVLPSRRLQTNLTDLPHQVK